MAQETMLASTATSNAIRLLESAELETNHLVMEQLIRAAEIWMVIAEYLRGDE